MVKKDSIIIVLIILTIFGSYTLYVDRNRIIYYQDFINTVENDKSELLEGNNEHDINENMSDTDTIIINTNKENEASIINSEEKNFTTIYENIITEEQEQDVLEYFKMLEQDVLEDAKETNFDKVKNKINSAFFTSVDFVFYDKPVRGVTFEQLTDKTKLQILKITKNIDNIITKKFPNYKEVIREKGDNTYILFNDNIKKLEHKIISKTSEEKYNNFIGDANNFKNKIINVKNKVVRGIKSWYENRSDN